MEWKDFLSKDSLASGSFLQELRARRARANRMVLDAKDWPAHQRARGEYDAYDRWINELTVDQREAVAYETHRNALARGNEGEKPVRRS